ncbi:MAG: class I SAM-dependent methyltransferase [Desulfovibrio sp.]|jgi:hypothetical protein|nr:class I SAM-dependent methyltransferase [Desulfovibrio sp.]
MFNTKFRYTDRASKGRYVWEKYQPVLAASGNVLDVGADKGALGPFLPKSVKYLTIGYGEHIAVRHNLENIPWPFADASFDVVLCLDVLEHLENIHAAFDECCRMAAKYVIISLPNPYADFMRFLYNGKYMGRPKDMKFYGLTPEPEGDRHRWFFSPTDARKFIDFRCVANGFFIIQHDSETQENIGGGGVKHPLQIFFRKDLPVQDFETGTLWWILQREKTI